MTFDPIFVFLLFIASVATGALVIYLTIQFRYRRPAQRNAVSDRALSNERLILSSEGLSVYRSSVPGPGQNSVYFLDVDDRIITGTRDASKNQYASIRCVVPRQVLQDLASAVRLDSDEEGSTQ